MITLRIIIEKVIYEDFRGWTVIHFLMNESSFRAVGSIGQVKSGETWEIKGEWEEIPHFGKQFRIKSGFPILPKTNREMISFLSGSQFEGIGIGTASQLVQHYGERLWGILEHSPEKLKDDGIITKHKASLIIYTSKSLTNRWRVLRFLADHQLPIRLARPLITLFQDKAIEKVKENPYILLSFVNWNDADRVARMLHTPYNDVKRLQASVIQILQQYLAKGFTAVPKGMLLEQASQLISVPAVDINNQLQPPLISFVNQKLVQLCGIASQEKMIANTVAQMWYNPFPLADRDWVNRWLDRYEKHKRITLEPEQREAVQQAVYQRLTIITGGAGTGKTSVVDAIYAILYELGEDILLAAPTGKASKRMQQATGKETKTLHRTFGYSQQYFSFRKTGQAIPSLIVDESSMIDLRMWHTIMLCMDKNSRLILVGDSAQLPPIGAGQVYYDLLEEPNLPIIRLTKIHRQASDNPIPYVSLSVKNGQIPSLPSWNREHLKGVYFLSQKDEGKGMEWIVRIVSQVLPSQGVPLEDIQVLCPKRNGLTGTKNINEILRKELGYKNISNLIPFALGDRVIQTVNNYDLGENGVMNGTTGMVMEMLENGILVDFEGEKVPVTNYALADLDHALAISVHKSQGSQFRVAIIPIYPSAGLLLSRQLIYTAITRATDLVIIIGMADSLEEGIKNDILNQRITSLPYHLVQALAMKSTKDRNELTIQTKLEY